MLFRSGGEGKEGEDEGGKNRMEDVIRKYFQCWLDKDINDVKEIFSDDIIYSECYGPVYKGIGQIIRWFDDWNRKGTVLQWDIKRVIASGNTAVVEWYFECDYEGNVDGFDIMGIESGRIEIGYAGCFGSTS